MAKEQALPSKKWKRESAAELRLRAKKILSRLRREFPEAATALHHRDAFQLLVATILSAQCTDERVNKVTPTLFKRYGSPQDFAKAKSEELESIIRSTGFFRAKAKSILGCSHMLVERFGGVVPRTMEELVQLPGVGRKTANVVLGNHFGIAAGIVVDTHVARLSQRFAFTQSTDPERIEQNLTVILSKKDWIGTGNLLILHGRATCKAQKPRCGECVLRDICPSSTV